MLGALFTCCLLVLSVDPSQQRSLPSEVADSAKDEGSPASNYLLGIINGELIDSDEWPFLASIQQLRPDGSTSHYCGGSVWNNQYILTAAHCAFYENNTRIPADHVFVYLGHTDISNKEKSSIFPADKFIVHEKYSGALSGYDIAVIRLKRKIDFQHANRAAKCVCNPKPMANVIAKDCWVIGWGAVQEKGYVTTKAREVQVPLREAAYCKKHKLAMATFDDSMLCAGYDEGGKDACQGDSGGPLMCAISSEPPIYALAGIVSYGNGCARVNQPGYYTKVYAYLDWISKQTGC